MQPPSSRSSRLAALAIAISAAFGATSATAVSLGAARVLSAGGEPLIAEIEIPLASPDDLANFRAGLASRAEFDAAGMVVHPGLQGVSFTIHRRANGQAYLRLVGTQPVGEGAIPIILHAEGNTRTVIRDYTLVVAPRRGAAPAQTAQDPVGLRGCAAPVR